MMRARRCGACATVMVAVAAASCASTSTFTHPLSNEDRLDVNDAVAAKPATVEVVGKPRDERLARKELNVGIDRTEWLETPQGSDDWSAASAPTHLVTRIAYKNR